ncbi:hypothetical protein XF35_05750 [Streptomyces platensis subsp. clarensis]|nr:hypothetical protein [Streptomyces platensis subsp. clarensis]
MDCCRVRGGSVALGLLGHLPPEVLGPLRQSAQFAGLVGQVVLVQGAEELGVVGDGRQECAIALDECPVVVAGLGVAPLVEAAGEGGNLVQGPFQCLQHGPVVLEAGVPAMAAEKAARVVVKALLRRTHAGPGLADQLPGLRGTSAERLAAITHASVAASMLLPISNAV